MSLQVIAGARIGQGNSPWQRTNPSFPPTSLDWALPPEQWQAVRKLLDADPNLTLRDIFSDAVGSYLDDLADVDPAEKFATTARKPVNRLPASLDDVRQVDLPLALLLRLALAAGCSVPTSLALVNIAIEQFIDHLTEASRSQEQPRPGRLYDLPGVVRCRMAGGVS